MNKRSCSDSGALWKNKKICKLPNSEVPKSYLKDDKPDLFESTIGICLPSNTEISLENFRKQFHLLNFSQFPPVIFIHQLYDRSANHSNVRNEIMSLQGSGKIKMFALEHNFENAIVFVEDLKTCLLQNNSSSAVKRFLDTILPKLRGPNIEKSVLEKFSSLEVKELIRSGLLVMVSETNYELSIPGVGRFLKLFKEGRKQMLNTINKRKYKEVLVSELKTMPLKKLSFGIDYHVADLIGADLVTSTETTSGLLLRYVNPKD